MITGGGGVLLVSSHVGNPIIDDLIAARVPTVVCGRFPGLETQLSMVGADDRDGGRQMTEHLISRGATRIAVITGPMDTPGGIGRLEGYQQALRAAGLPVLPERVRHSSEMVRLLLARIESGVNATVTVPTTLIPRASTLVTPNSWSSSRVV